MKKWMTTSQARSRCVSRAHRATCQCAAGAWPGLTASLATVLRNRLASS